MLPPATPDWARYVRERLPLSRLQPEREAEIVEELAGQLEQAYAEALGRGLTSEQAEAAARRHISDWASFAAQVSRSERGRESALAGIQHRAEDRDVARRGRFFFWTTLGQDLLYAVRILSKSPGFTAAAVLTMALGIGANTAIFSLIDAVLLRSLPVRNSQELVLLHWSARKEPRTYNSSGYGDCEIRFTGLEAHGCNFSKPFIEQVRAQTAVFSGVAAFASAGQLNLSGSGPARLARGQYVSGDYFPALGLRPAAGRLLAPSDDSPSAPEVAVLSYGYWQSEFGGEPGVIGRSIHLQGFPFTVVGVAEASFSNLTPGNSFDLWVPMAVRPKLEKGWTPASENAGSWWVVALARLKTGVSRSQAEAAVRRVFYNQMLHGDKPLFEARDAPALQLLPANTGLTGVRRKLSAPLYVLMLAVGIVLLIACANVAGLMLARAAGRQKEIAVRLALGASRGRIVRQLLTESLAISTAGGALGIAMAIWSARGLLQLLATIMDRPTGFSANLDPRVLAFTLAASIVTGILFGLVPAISSLRLDLTPALKDGAKRTPRGDRPRGWFNSGSVLVVAQVALTVVMLVGAGLLVRTLESLKRVDPGFETGNVLTFRVDPTLTGYKGEQIGALFRELRERFGAVPGVTSASYSMVPLLSGILRSTGFRLHGLSTEKESDADSLPVGPGFFDTMRMPMVAGRDFRPAEFEATGSKPGSRCSRASDARAPVAAIVNESFVRAYFPGQNPMGQRFGGGEDPDAGPDACPDAGWEIVGVVHDARYRSLHEEIHPTIYEPSGEGGSFELRTASDPRAVIASVRDVIKRTGFDLPIYEIKTQLQQIEDQLFQERLLASLSSLFGVLALLLACIGLYGLLSFEVAGRTREIGIRMALGARAADVHRQIVVRGIAITVAGVALGIAGALGLTRYLGSMLFGVKPGDPLTLAAVSALLLLVAFGASYGPARRATHVDPLVALRYE